MSLAQYNKAMELLAAAGAKSPQGRIIHICYGDDPQLKIMTVWESQDHFQAMAPILLPVLSQVGIEVDGPPLIYWVQDIQYPIQ